MEQENLKIYGSPDQCQQPFVADFSGHPHHQYVVLDAVEKFRQVHVDALTITGTDVGLDLLRCFVGGAAWSKAKTRFRESGIENRREDLQDGLLDQAIDHVWNSEISLTAIRFGNRLPPGRARLVSPFQELPPELQTEKSVPAGVEKPALSMASENLMERIVDQANLGTAWKNVRADPRSMSIWSLL